MTLTTDLFLHHGVQSPEFPPRGVPAVSFHYRERVDLLQVIAGVITGLAGGGFSREADASLGEADVVDVSTPHEDDSAGALVVECDGPATSYDTVDLADCPAIKVEWPQALMLRYAVAIQQSSLPKLR